MVDDAETHAEEDMKAKEAAEARNNADTLIYTTERSIKDLGDKVDEETKKRVEDAIAALRKAMETDDDQEIKRLSEELTQQSHKLAEVMYQQQEAAAGGEPQAAGASEDEEVIDAEVVDSDGVEDDARFERFPQQPPRAHRLPPAAAPRSRRGRSFAPRDARGRTWR